MRLCLIWNLHQPNSWHPIRGGFELPWTRIQSVRAWLPLLHMMRSQLSLPVSVAVSPDVLWQVAQMAFAASRESLLDLSRKPAADLRDVEIADLIDFAFVATPERIAAPFPAWIQLWSRWRQSRGVASRFLASIGRQELQDLQVLTQLAWLDGSLQRELPELLERAHRGEAMTTGDGQLLADLQLSAMQELLRQLRERCRSGEMEYLGAPLHRAVLPLLCDAEQGIDSPEDLRAQLVRGPRRHYQNFGHWPPILHLPEGALCETSAILLKQACLDRAVASSRVLSATLGRRPTSKELCARWDFQGRELLFTHTELSDRVRFVFPHMDPETAVREFRREVEAIAADCQGDEHALVVELDASIPASRDAASAKAFWEHLFAWLEGGSAPRLSTIAGAFQELPRNRLPRLVAGARSVRGVQAWGAESHPPFWDLLRHAREQFQNVRAWKTLAPDALSRARHALFALESSDWMGCMEAGLDAFTRRKTEELLRAHFELVYRNLELERPSSISRPFFPCEVKTTSIGPSQPITPLLDGKLSSYHSWIGAGFYRTRQEGGCSIDPWRQISGVHFGEDGAYAYLRVALPLQVRVMLGEFEIQGVFHAAEGEQTVSWFRLRAAGDGGAPILDTRFAVPPADRDEERPLAEVAEVADLRFPLSALGVRLGEVLRFQVSLWERGNAVASAPPLGWEEFEIANSMAYEEPPTDAFPANSL